jgi:Glycosyl transferase family 2
MDPSRNSLLSVVVVIVSDTTDSRSDVSHLAPCLEALSQQVDAPPMEIIVPYHGNVSGMELIKAQYPDVVFIAANDLKTYTGHGGSREHHDELRARGLAVARGEIIGLLEDHARPDPRWCARMVEAHQQTYAAVGGAIENGIDRPLNWAVYFCDFGKYQNPLPAGESLFVSDANVSYKRSALESIRSTWQETFHETAVNWTLVSRGEKLALSPKIIVYQNRGSLRLGNALKERFIWGRSYAATRATLAGGFKRAIYAALSPVLPLILLGRMAANVLKKRRCIGAFLKALPLTAALTVSWSLGELTGYLTGRANSSGAAAGGTIAHASDGLIGKSKR